MTSLGRQFGPLFHGSRQELEGDTLKPGLRMGAATGGDPHKHRGQSRKDVVSASTDEHKAWSMAGVSNQSGGRQKVWRVAQHPETRIGVENKEHPVFQRAQAKNLYTEVIDNDEVVAPHFKVLEQIDTKPGNQGTFPQVDWNAHRPVGNQFDANHPPHPNQDAQHRRALVEHYDRANPGADMNDARKARLASKPAPHTETPGQLELHLGPQFRSTT